MDIDREVAEKVMGWKVWPETSIKKELLYDESKGFDREIDSWNFIIPTEDFNPSTNISDAWLVVEKMREMGRLIMIQQVMIPLYKWECKFTDIKANDRGFHTAHVVTSDTAPMAICLAALKAQE